MKQNITELLAEKDRIESRLKLVNEAIKILRSLCEHEWMHGGNDSHYDYEKCKHCGERRQI
ncbi:MAG: formate dehydrogenase accessory protein FdhE [Prevotellaceae bacterium]|jgi:hypothetical protein|nr:formate dehydrogenase accessory protein FdhE [Prevotellaceae bacterium]